MIIGYSAQTVRAAERPLLEAGEPLMERASRALADQVLSLLAQDAVPSAAAAGDEEALAGSGQVLLLAGPGANGGDGLHAAALLRGRGVRTETIAVADHLHAEGAAALEQAGGTVHTLEDLDEQRLRQLVEDAELILDAMFGIGGRPELPARLGELLETVREVGAPVIAVDLPSGLDATTGQADPATLHAERTITFGAATSGLLLEDGPARCGEIRLVDIGLGEHLPDPAEDPRAVLQLEDVDVRALWPRAQAGDHKYSRGVVALAAGSAAFPGAAVLCAAAAARAGAGMVRILAPRAVIDHVLHARPEVVGHPMPDADAAQHPEQPAIDLEAIGRTDALVLGPGLAPGDPRARAGIALLTRTDGAADGAEGEGMHERALAGVVDAGALAALRPEDRFGPDVVLTPHAGEAARLAQTLSIDPDQPRVDLARELSRATGATVLLKGATTLIAAPGQVLLAQADGPPQLATAGTGDVLAGIIGTLLAAGLPGPRAAALAALIHGRAGYRASHGGASPLVAGDLPDNLPSALNAILAPAQQ